MRRRARRSTPRRSSTTPGWVAWTTALSSWRNVDGLEILAPPVAVRHPLARRAGVVEVEHRGDAVDPQAVRVELLEPVERVRDEEVPHLVPAVVEDERAPVRVRAAARDPRARRARSRRTGSAPSRPPRSGPAPSRGSPRSRCRGSGRRRPAGRPARRAARAARRSPRPGTPRTGRRDAASPGGARRA